MPVSRKINAGRLDMLLTFQSEVDGTDAIGDHVKTWTNYRSAYGMINQSGGGEGFEASQLVGSNRINVLIRFDSGVTKSMRFTVNGGSEYFYVTDVQGWEREGFTNVMAEKRDNQ